MCYTTLTWEQRLVPALLYNDLHPSQFIFIEGAYKSSLTNFQDILTLNSSRFLCWTSLISITCTMIRQATQYQNAYMKSEMFVNEHVVMSSNQRSSLCHPTKLLLLFVQIFQEHQLNSTIFPVFPGGISNSWRFPVVPGVVDTLPYMQYKSQLKS